MRVADTMRRAAVSIDAGKTIHEAARLMDDVGVGALAVLDGDHLAGIVTDRDLVRRALATGVAADARVDSVMSTPLVTIDADSDLHEAFGLFRTNAVRRLPITERGRFIGMITVDDLLIDLASDLGALARPVTAEVVFGHHDSPTPATTS